jgi:hypothetical protein
MMNKQWSRENRLDRDDEGVHRGSRRERVTTVSILPILPGQPTLLLVGENEALTEVVLLFFLFGLGVGWTMSVALSGATLSS